MPVSNFDAVIVGAGLAGSALAHVLARRGLRLAILEKRAEPASAASGNPAGILIPYLTKTATPESRFYEAAWKSILDWPLLEKARVGKRGALQLAHKAEMEERFCQALQRFQEKDPKKNYTKKWKQMARPVSKKEASELAGVELNFGGLFYPDGGLVLPKKLCALCLNNKETQLYRNTSVLNAIWLAKERCWKVQSSQGDFLTPILMLANAHEARALSIANWLPIYPVRGQIFYLEGKDTIKNLHYPLIYDGYMLPVLPDGRQILGAAFEHWNKNPTLSGEQNEAIYGLAARILPELHQKRMAVFQNPGRVAFRSTSTDRFPVVGPLADFTTLETGIQKNRRLRHQWSLSWPWDLSLPQLYVSLAHASRGILSVLLSAELIARHLENQKPVQNHGQRQKAQEKNKKKTDSGKAENTSATDLAFGLEEDILHALLPTRFLRRRFRKTGKISDSA